MKIKIIISALLTVTGIYLISIQFMDIFCAVILCCSFAMSAYFSKHFEYVSFTNSNYEVTLVCNVFGIPRLKFNNVQVLRKIAGSYIWASRVFACILPMSISIIVNEFLKTTNNLSWINSIIGTLLGVIFHINDIKKLFKIWFGKHDSLYVKFLDDEMELIKTDGVLYSHREVYFYEEAFRDYSKDDLRRELILIEQNINNMNQNGVWDKYFVPILFIFVTTIYGMINSVFILDITSSETDIEYLMKQYMVLITIIALLIFQVFIIKHFMLVPPKSNMIVKKMILEDMLKNS